MASVSRSQNAGKNSQQLIVDKLFVGITEERARAIADESAKKALQEYSNESEILIQKRLKRLDSKLIRRLSKIEHGFEKLADPSVQKLLWEAHLTAAATERSTDYDMLAELLAYRIEKGEPRVIRTAIKGAIDIIDDIDSKALCGLTVHFCLAHMLPLNKSCLKALATLDQIFESLCIEDLPIGKLWFDHLDSLQAIRIFPAGKFQNTIDFYSRVADGYLCAGIRANSKQYDEALEILQQNQLSKDYLIENELLSGYFRLPLVNKEDIFDDNKYDEHLQLLLKKLWDLYDTDISLLEQVKKVFLAYWNQFESLLKVRIWEDNLPAVFVITHIGKVLAYSNAKRMVKSLPDITLDDTI